MKTKQTTSTKKTVMNKISRLMRLNYGQIQVGGEIGRRIDVTRTNNMLVIDVEKNFLDAYRKHNAEEYCCGAPLGGMFLDAVVQHAAYSKDSRLLELKRHFVKELLASQTSDGCIGVGGWWDRHEGAYLIIGLLRNTELFGEKESLAAAVRLGRYWLAQTDTTKQALNTIAWENALVALTEATGDDVYRRHAVEVLGLPQWKGSAYKDDGHTYAVFCRAVGQLDLSLQTADSSLLDHSRQILAFLLNERGLFVNGTCGEYWECWQSPIHHDGRADADFVYGPSETCSTAYQIRWYDRLMQLEGKPLYGDLMERSIYNGLFAAQSPEGRQIRYNTAFTGRRFYWPIDYMCCPDNYRRIVVELARMLYYHAGDDVFANLYAPSTATIPLPGGQSVRIEQTTRYPIDGAVEFRMTSDQPAEFTLHLRIPSWCEGAVIAVNGQTMPDAPKSGTYHSLRLLWKTGDTVTLTLPMRWRWVRGEARQHGRNALMRGPLVFGVRAQSCLDGLSATDKVLAPDVQTRLAEHLAGGLIVNPASVELQPREDAEGFAITSARGWKTRVDQAGDAMAAIPLELAAFAHPDLLWTYVNLPDATTINTIEDELYDQGPTVRSIWFREKIRSWKA